MKAPAFLLFLLLISTFGGPAAGPAAAATGVLPSDIKAFVARRERCAHWEGEEPYDRARSAEIATAMRRLRCSAVDDDETRLRRLHRNDGDVLKVLDAGGDE